MKPPKLAKPPNLLDSLQSQNRNITNTNWNLNQNLNLNYKTFQSKISIEFLKK